jgi:catechol 2,3-dioxygenase-like lactoylglutathione lyase family enzyme
MTVTLQRVQHVSVARPRGEQEAAATRRFYGEALGLQEVAPPSSLADLDLIWYRLGDDELHIFTTDDPPGDHGQHFCIQVDDVAALRDQLSRAGVAIVEDTAIHNRPRFFIHDPFGNRIECTTILGPYE